MRSEGAQRVNARGARVYLQWSKEEDTILLERFAKGARLSDLAEAHGRSLGAIKSRLLHLGKTPR